VEVNFWTGCRDLHEAGVSLRSCVQMELVDVARSSPPRNRLSHGAFVMKHHSSKSSCHLTIHVLKSNTRSCDIHAVGI
jgi:hypothetical protein